MLDPKKVIPKLAVAALALTGCGGDGGTPPVGTGGTGGAGGTGGTGGTGGGNGSLTASLQAFCVKLVECFPGYYQSAEQCTNYLINYYGFDGEVSAACEAAAISYFDCGTQLSCPELDAYSNSCEDEFGAAVQACTTQ